MKANRFAYGEAVLELAKADPHIVVVDSDLGKGLGYADFKQAFPERYFDCGIAEQNMTSVAVGLATTGLIPFAGSFAVFMSMRALDQVRNGAALYDLNVKFIGSHAGTETAQDGATHQSIEDVAIMRALPHMRILAPCCPVQTAALTRLAAETQGTFYLRFGRGGNTEHYTTQEHFELGGSKQLRAGDDYALLAYGRMVDVALDAAKLLENEGVHCRVLDMYSLKPLDENAVLRAAKETKGIVTIEDHSVIGGLGGAVSELLCERYPAKIKRIGLRDCYGRSGEMNDVFRYFGLTAEATAQTVREMNG